LGVVSLDVPYEYYNTGNIGTTIGKFYINACTHSYWKSEKVWSMQKWLAQSLSKIVL